MVMIVAAGVTIQDYKGHMKSSLWQSNSKRKLGACRLVWLKMTIGPWTSYPDIDRMKNTTEMIEKAFSLCKLPFFNFCNSWT